MTATAPTPDPDDYKKHYSEDGFWDKLLHYGKKAGVQVAYAALVLYYTAKQPSTPAHAKATVFGALGYFIAPLDIIPDFVPVIGYADDLSVIIGALIIIVTHINDESKQQARTKIVDWFGENALAETEKIDKKIDKGKKEKGDK